MALAPTVSIGGLGLFFSWSSLRRVYSLLNATINYCLSGGNSRSTLEFVFRIPRQVKMPRTPIEIKKSASSFWSMRGEELSSFMRSNSLNMYCNWGVSLHSISVTSDVKSWWFRHGRGWNRTGNLSNLYQRTITILTCFKKLPDGYPWKI